MILQSFSLRTIYTSRVNPTVEAEINGVIAAAPSGASTGTHEAACFVPDDLDKVEQQIRDMVDDQDLTQEQFDGILQDVDGTDNFSSMGAAAIASSLAFRKARGFDHDDATFPYPVGNLVGGGAHGGSTQIQEFLVIPTNADSVPDAMELLSDAYHEFKDRYKQRIRGVNDEGAYVTDLTDEETLDVVKTVADEYGMRVGIDAAATEYYNQEKEQYTYPEMGMALTTNQQVKFVETLVDRFGLLYVEDPLHEDEYEGFADLTSRVDDTLIVGDDLFVTQQDRLQHGIDLDAGNSLIVKPNQAGTITATTETLALARNHDYTPIVSHRSGETCDPVIADLAVAWNAPFIKSGISGIRTAKNNQLLRLWSRYGGEMAEREWPT